MAPFCSGQGSRSCDSLPKAFSLSFDMDVATCKKAVSTEEDELGVALREELRQITTGGTSQ